MPPHPGVTQVTATTCNCHIHISHSWINDSAWKAVVKPIYGKVRATEIPSVWLLIKKNTFLCTLVVESEMEIHWYGS